MILINKMFFMPKHKYENKRAQKSYRFVNMNRILSLKSLKLPYFISDKDI